MVQEWNIYTLRHGRTLWNDEGRFQGSTRHVALNEQGRTGSSGVEARIGGQVRKAYASPTIRAHETASIIVPHVEVLDDLLEANFGSAEGQIIPIGQGTQYPTLIHACVALQEEAHDKLSERIRGAFRYIVEHEPAGDILAVSHAYWIAYAVALLKNESRSADNLLKYFLPNVGFHVLSFNRNAELIAAKLHAHE